MGFFISYFILHTLYFCVGFIKITHIDFEVHFETKRGAPMPPTRGSKIALIAKHTVHKVFKTGFKHFDVSFIEIGHIV